MRAFRPLVLGLGLSLAAGCVPDKRDTPEWQKPPKAWDPKGAEHLTLSEKGLDAFNTLSLDDQQQWIEDMVNKPGSFVGQAIYKQGSELGEKMDDFVLGNYEITTDLPDPVLFEITLHYSLFTTPDKGKNLPPNSYIEFKGTLAELDYQADSKPRKISLKVQADEITVLKDTP